MYRRRAPCPSASALLAGDSEVGSESAVRSVAWEKPVTATELQELMMAGLFVPQGYFSLRESRCFCNCLFLRRPWEFGAGAVGKVNKGQQVQIRHPSHLLRSTGATYLQRKSKGWTVRFSLLPPRSDLNLEGTNSPAQGPLLDSRLQTQVEVLSGG